MRIITLYFYSVYCWKTMTAHHTKYQQISLWGYIYIICSTNKSNIFLLSLILKPHLFHNAACRRTTFSHTFTSTASCVHETTYKIMVLTYSPYILKFSISNRHLFAFPSYLVIRRYNFRLLVNGIYNFCLSLCDLNIQLLCLLSCLFEGNWRTH